MKREDTAKPFLKWVGGKGRVIAQLEQFFPDNFNNYFEPFVGGGAIYFHLGSKKSTINDINNNLTCTYINVRDNVEDLIKELIILKDKYMSLNPESQKTMYYEVRDEFNKTNNRNTIRKSALLIFLNKTCFNGMYRENKKGQFNVPFNNSKNPPICDEDGLRVASKRLAKVKILSKTYSVALKNAKEGDFVYLDPPYYPLNPTSSFTSYTEGDFTEQDQIMLKNLFDDLTLRGCKVMMSNSYTKFIINLYKDYKQHKIYVGRAINSNGKNRGKIAEIVVTNY
jgi:DNA adenine methylase